MMKKFKHNLISCLLTCLLGLAPFALPAQATPSKISLWSLLNPLSYKGEENIWVRIRQDLGIPLAQTSSVKSQVQWYQKHLPYIERSLKKGNPYLYHIVQELEKRHLPLAFALIPMIESAYDPTALSKDGAAGLWQLMPATARSYGIKQNGWYDGRKDFLASTDAALDYLSYLGEFFDHDWLLVLAAYNVGEGYTQRAIARNQKAGRPTDFWSLQFPRETQRYVQQFLALSEILTHAEQYSLRLPETPHYSLLSYVELERQVDLTTAAHLAEIPLTELYKLNPGYKQRHSGPDGPHRLFLPRDHVYIFRNNIENLPPMVRASWQIKSQHTQLSNF